MSDGIGDRSQRKPSGPDHPGADQGESQYAPDQRWGWYWDILPSALHALHALRTGWVQAVIGVGLIVVGWVVSLGGSIWFFVGWFVEAAGSVLLMDLWLRADDGFGQH